MKEEILSIYQQWKIKTKMCKLKKHLKIWETKPKEYEQEKRLDARTLKPKSIKRKTNKWKTVK